MRTLTKVLIALLGLLLSPVAAHAQTGPLAFGVLNQQSPALTAERWNPILHYTTLVSGVPLQLKMGRTVQETDAMMARGDFDFVFTNHNFQSEFDAIGFKVLAKWAGEPIRAVIAAPADSPIQNLRDLEGKRVSFPSTDVFVAYAVPLVALKRAGGRVEQVFGGNQEGTLAQLKAKRVEAGAVPSRSTPSVSTCSSARSTCPRATPTWR
jgi:phosphonate transport system substrate-binding protein